METLGADLKANDSESTVVRQRLLQVIRYALGRAPAYWGVDMLAAADALVFEGDIVELSGRRARFLYQQPRDQTVTPGLFFVRPVLSKHLLQEAFHQVRLESE